MHCKGQRRQNSKRHGPNTGKQAGVFHVSTFFGKNGLTELPPSFGESAIFVNSYCGMPSYVVASFLVNCFFSRFFRERGAALRVVGRYAIIVLKRLTSNEDDRHA